MTENPKLSLASADQVAERARSEPAGSKLLPVGVEAPNFTLPVTLERAVSLRDFRGKSVILVFYPADWSPVCSDQLALYNQVLPQFQKLGAELLGVSVDGVWCHRAFADARRLRFPLLADFEPKGAVAQAYGVYCREHGVSERALFVIDPSGKIAWSYRSPVMVNPGADGILRALEDLADHRSTSPSPAATTLLIPVTPEDHSQGPHDAAVTLVEYGDYECLDCEDAYPIIQRVQQHFGERLRFIFRNFPMSELHPHAQSAAETAEFAAAHGKFWPMHHGLFASEGRLGGRFYSALAENLALSPAELHQALDQGRYRDRVQADFDGGVRSGVNRTPTFFINEKRHDGPFDYDNLVLAIEQVLAGCVDA
jgi:peroxiredoxin/protein-disulfide isomerase